MGGRYAAMDIGRLGVFACISDDQIGADALRPPLMLVGWLAARGMQVAGGRRPEVRRAGEEER